MGNSAARARARLDAWHRQHAGGLEPMRLRILDALAMRADRHDGEVRRILDEKLSALLDAWAPGRGKTEPCSDNAGGTTSPPVPARGMLGELLEQLAGPAGAREATADAPAAAPSFPELAALDEFRQTWSALRTESQLRQSLQQAPVDAGPLNSATLVHRSIALMRELSPEYLQHFLAYADVLSWMDQTRATAPTAPAKPRTRRAAPRSRKPRQ